MSIPLWANSISYRKEGAVSWASVQLPCALKGLLSWREEDLQELFTHQAVGLVTPESSQSGRYSMGTT